jgi:hypothetical protein
MDLEAEVANLREQLRLSESGRVRNLLFWFFVMY